MLTKDQIEARKGKLFATDAAAALGVSKYRTPYQLWLEKTGAMDTAFGNDPPDYILLGELFEPQIAAFYERKAGRTLYPLKETVMHDTIPWMGSHFDYRADDRLVEIKNFGLTRRKEFGEPGSDDVPPDVKVQVVHEMVVAGVPLCDVAVVFGGNSFAVFTVRLNDRDEEELIEREVAFMRYITDNVMPPPQDAEDLKLRYPMSTVESVVATQAIEQAVALRRQLGERVGDLDDTITNLDNEIKGYMGEAGLLLDTNGTVLASWRSNKAGEMFDAKSFAKRHPRVFAKYCKPRAGARPFLIKEEK